MVVVRNMYKLVLVHVLTVFLLSVLAKPVEELKSRNVDSLSTETVDESAEGELAASVQERNADADVKNTESQRDSVSSSTESKSDSSGRRVLKHTDETSVQEQNENEVRSATDSNVSDQNSKSEEQLSKNNGVLIASSRASQNIVTNDVDATANLLRKNYEQDSLENSRGGVSQGFENTDEVREISDQTRRTEVDSLGIQKDHSINHHLPGEGTVDSRKGPLLLAIDSDDVTVAIEVVPETNERIGHGYNDNIHSIEHRNDVGHFSNIVPGNVKSNVESDDGRDAKPEAGSNPDEKLRTSSSDNLGDKQSPVEHIPDDITSRQHNKPVKDILTDREHLVEKNPAVLTDDKTPKADSRDGEVNKDKHDDRRTKDVSEIIIPSTFDHLPNTIKKVPVNEILSRNGDNKYNNNFLRLIRPEVSLLSDLRRGHHTEPNVAHRSSEEEDIGRAGDYDISDRNAYPYTPNVSWYKGTLPFKGLYSQHHSPEGTVSQNHLGSKRKFPSHFNAFTPHINFRQGPTYGNNSIPTFPQFNPASINPIQFNQNLNVPHLNNVPNQFSHPAPPSKYNQNAFVPHQYKAKTESPSVIKYRFRPQTRDDDEDFMENTPIPTYRYLSAPATNTLHLENQSLPPPPRPHYYSNPLYHPNEFNNRKPDFSNDAHPSYRIDTLHPVSDISRNYPSFNLPPPSLPPLQSFRSVPPRPAVLPSTPKQYQDLLPNLNLYRPFLPVSTQTPFVPWTVRSFIPITTPISRNGLFTIIG